MISAAPNPGSRANALPAREHATLDAQRPGGRCVVRAVEGTDERRRRLFEMGFTAGTELRVVRFAPWGDPMQVSLRGYHLSLRRSEARTVRVEAL